MGAACCVSAKDKTIQRPSDEILHRNFRQSPTWSFRWDSRVGVAGEETSRNDALDVKSATAVSPHVSDGGSSLESYRMDAWRKSLLNQETSKNFTPSSGQSLFRDVSLELKNSTDSPQVSDPSSFIRSPSIYSTPSVSLSPLSIEERHIPCGNHAAATESTRDSYSFSELTSVSFDGDLTHNKTGRAGGQNYSGSISMDLQTCIICSKCLTEKSAWSSQKIVVGNELSIIAVLLCGHVYHAECLETMTPEVNKYDPGCPVCTFGEKQTFKLCEKMLKEEKDLKARYIKKSKNRVVGTDDSFDFDHWNSGGLKGRSPKLSVSSSLKLSGAKPFLKRHFSFGSKSSNQSVRKKGLFWAKSSRK